MRLIALLLLGFATTAAAQSYSLSAAFGRADLKAGRADGSAEVLRIGAAYPFTDRFSLELAYYATGDAGSTDREVGATTQTVSNASVDTKGAGLFARWSMPVTEWLRVGARGGAYRVTATVEERVVEQDNAPPFNPRVLSDTKRTQTEWLPAVALTADVMFGKSARLGMAYEEARGDMLERMRSVTGYFQMQF